MRWSDGRRKTRWFFLGLAMTGLCGATTGLAQVPSQSPFDTAPPPPPPSPNLPPTAATREAELENRIRQLESMVNRLSNQVNGAGAAGGSPGGAMAGAVGRSNESPGAARPDAGPPGAANAPSQSGGASAPGQSLPPNPAPSARFDSPARLESKKASVKFGPGFEIKSDDDEFIFQFHNLTQFDYRGYQQGGQNPVRDTFSFPRQWFMFSGRITKPFGYFVSLANGFDSLALLDAFVDVDYDPRLKLRLGRFKTPFTYEFLVEPIQGLISPERSLFFNNFGQNRDLGAMAFGRLFNNKFDYAGGIFNGSRNQLLATHDAKFVSAFVNYKPWGDEENTLLENLNLGGSVYAGHGSNPTQPQTLRTAVATSGSPVIGVPFLGFNSNIREQGFQAFWDLHFAYYYQHLAVIGEWGSGFQDYAPTSNLNNKTRLPVDSFYVQAGYLLTGETRSSTGIVRPLRPFDLRKGKVGPGAWELTGRYNHLNLGNQVFTNGLADPNLWSNSVSMVDVGMNWHLTQYVKVYFDWQHADYGSSVLFAPGRLQKNSDMFLLRFQLFF